VEAAEQMMHRNVGTTYYAPQFDPKKQPTVDEKTDILRELTETCRAELRG